MEFPKVNEELKYLVNWCEEVMGRWNGDESGTQEELAMEAREILEVTELLQRKLEELKNY